MRVVVFVVLFGILLPFVFAEVKECNQSPIKIEPDVRPSPNKDYVLILLKPIAEVHLLYLPSGKPEQVILNLWDHAFWLRRSEEIKNTIYYWTIEDMWPEPHETLGLSTVNWLNLRFPISTGGEGLDVTYIWHTKKYYVVPERISFDVILKGKDKNLYKCEVIIIPRERTLLVK